ncbi:class I SAM-dependent methyltransferase [Actinophytocola sp.]|uniref:class I SAM-dependent methyltransferase n=1 Tax=Actinophytocola sp. TaxID=1872138 RepID=UPI003D6AFE4E
MTTTRPNDWSGRDGAYWAEHDVRYDTVLGPLTPHLLAAADLRPTDRVLDVGCGCGNTTRLAGRRAADVLGVDLSEAMLARARQRTAEAGLTNVRFERADAQRTAFEPVDLVMSQLGIMFFDDPAAAFANLRRAGRRLAFLCWQRLELNENRYVLREALGPHVDLPAPRTTVSALSLADPTRIDELLTGAGFRDIEIQDVREPLLLGRDADDAVEFELADPTVHTWLTEAGPAAARKATDALREAYAARQTPEGVLLGSAAWLVTAR